MKFFKFGLAVLMTATLSVTAQETKQQTQVSATPAQKSEPVKPNPGPENAILKLEEGVWDAEIEFPAVEAGKPPSKAKGIQTNLLISGNTWIKNDFKVYNTPYEGHGVWGYNPQKQKFTGIWVDTNQDFIRFDEGTFDKTTNTMTWWAVMPNPDGTPVKWRFVEEFKGKTRIFTMTAIGPQSGKEYPQGKITFTKQE